MKEYGLLPSGACAAVTKEKAHYGASQMRFRKLRADGAAGTQLGHRGMDASPCQYSLRVALGKSFNLPGAQSLLCYGDKGDRHVHHLSSGGRTRRA